MSDIILNYQQIQDGAGRLRAAREEISTKLNELSTMIQDLTTGGYVTPKSAPAFKESGEQFLAAQQKSIEALDSLASFLDSSLAGFKGVDEGR